MYQVQTSLLGRSFLRRRVAAAKRVANRTVVGRVAVRAGEVAGRNVAKAARAVGHVAAEGGRVMKRQAQRLIRSVARPIIRKMLNGDMDFILGGENPSSISAAKKQLIQVAVIGPATAAIAASPAAPLAPTVPVLVPPIIDQILDEIGKAGMRVLDGPDKKAIVEEKKDIQTGKRKTLILAGIGSLTILALFALIRNRKGKNAVNS